MRDYIDDFEICFSDLSDEAKLALCKNFGGKENLKKFLYWRENLNGNGTLTTIESFYDDWADEDFDQYPDFDTFMEGELAGFPEGTDESANRSETMKSAEKDFSFGSDELIDDYKD